MYRNCRSRSGSCVRAKRLRLVRNEYFLDFSNRPTVPRPMRNPKRCKIFARFRVDLCVQRNPVTGSPAVAPSTRACNCFTTAGSFFQELAASARFADAPRVQANATAQFCYAASNRRATQPRNLGHLENAPMAAPHGQQPREQAPLSFIQYG